MCHVYRVWWSCPADTTSHDKPEARPEDWELLEVQSLSLSLADSEVCQPRGGLALHQTPKEPVQKLQGLQMRDSINPILRNLFKH